MKREPVTSSQIKSVGYDPSSSTLELEFVHGGSVYQYSNVTLDDYRALMSAESLGSHFLKQIKPRPDRFPFRKVETQTPAKAQREPFTKRKKREQNSK